MNTLFELDSFNNFLIYFSVRIAFYLLFTFWFFRRLKKFDGNRSLIIIHIIGAIFLGLAYTHNSNPFSYTGIEMSNNLSFYESDELYGYVNALFLPSVILFPLSFAGGNDEVMLSNFKVVLKCYMGIAGLFTVSVYWPWLLDIRELF